MRSSWKGYLGFGLVNIPVALGNAVRSEETKFRMLRGSDMSPIKFKRVAEADDKEVPHDKIVKGFEYEKGKYVAVKDEDLESIETVAKKAITIEAFVDMEDVSPLHFYKPYYLEPQKGGDHAYALLRDAMKATGKIGIARLVMTTKQHLAAVKPQDEVLILELMHFADEIVDVEEVRQPAGGTVSKKEIEMAKHLIGAMARDWDPAAFKDDYAEQLNRVIQAKVKAGGKSAPPAKTKAPEGVIDIMGALQASLRTAGKKKVVQMPRRKKAG